jgi:aspartate-semialdehyde dehydrogenase
MNRIPVGVLGATGMVGQRFLTLLKDHPWFEVVAVAASPRSAGKPYAEAVDGRWVMREPIPEPVANLTVGAVGVDAEAIAEQVKIVFCALDMDKAEIRRLEERYAGLGMAVVSNNSAHRWTDDVPMVLPEINPEHLALIDVQRENRGWDQGLIVVKPNCSIQSYVPQLTALWDFKPRQVLVSTFQAVSGAGKTMQSWPEMEDNVIPFIGGEEEKSEREPLRIWGALQNGAIAEASEPRISATCVRAPVSDGHLATVSVSFEQKPTEDQMQSAWRGFNPLDGLDLPSAPTPFITVFEEDDRPQTRPDRELADGMGVSVGRLRPDPILDWKFVGLSHNTIRGAAGGAILTAELLKKRGYLG